MELLPALGIHWLIQMLFVDVKVIALTAPANMTLMVLLNGVLTHLCRQASDSRFTLTNQRFVYPF
jgi:hypothetical protein